MNFDFNKILHNYIVRIVIFSIFLYRDKRFDERLFNLNINNFVCKRVPYKLNITTRLFKVNDLAEEREIIINDILNDVTSEYGFMVETSFKTPLKEVSMIIDLRDEDKYLKYLNN